MRRRSRFVRHHAWAEEPWKTREATCIAFAGDMHRFPGRQTTRCHATVPFVPHYPDSQAVSTLLARMRMALGITQKDLATRLNVARRTVGRWEGRQSTPTVEQLREIARFVYPRDPALASDIAAEGNATLEGLRLVVPQTASPPPVVPPSPPPRPFPPVDLMADSIVHVAVQALEAGDPRNDSMATVQAVLRAAFARALGLGLTIAEVADALRGSSGSRSASKAGPVEDASPAFQSTAGRPSRRHHG